MRLYHRNNTIHGFLMESQMFPDSNIFLGMDYYEIDQIKDIAEGLCRQIISEQGLMDINGNPRFWIDYDGDLDDRREDPGGWEAHIDPGPEFEV